MLSKISFYILANNSLKARDLYACRIIEKAYNNRYKAYIHFATAEEAQNFDVQLWTFRDISFIPHDIYNQNINSEAQVLLGYDMIPTGKNDILINLTPEAPSFYEQFNHIIEVIPNDEPTKIIARKKYQAYQKQGLKIETFNV